MNFVAGNFAQCASRSGCLGLFCSQCIEQQNLALCQVSKLMERLEYAESLFQSSRAFAVQYPLFKSSEFTNRVKVRFSTNFNNHLLMHFNTFYTHQLLRVGCNTRSLATV